jgi:hypothetical protein
LNGSVRSPIAAAREQARKTAIAVLGRKPGTSVVIGFMQKPETGGVP